MYSEIISQRIRNRMAELNFNETKLAGDSGLSVDTVKAVLKGADNVRMKTYENIATALGKDVYWLFQRPKQARQVAV